jgi:hypothetical protein
VEILKKKIKNSKKIKKQGDYDNLAHCEFQTNLLLRKAGSKKNEGQTENCDEGGG